MYSLGKMTCKWPKIWSSSCEASPLHPLTFNVQMKILGCRMRIYRVEESRNAPQPKLPSLFHKLEARGLQKGEKQAHSAGEKTVSNSTPTIIINARMYFAVELINCHYQRRWLWTIRANEIQKRGSFFIFSFRFLLL